MRSRIFSLVCFTATAGLTLAGCATELGLVPSKPKIGAIVVGDEPYAVSAAASIMAAGGNAADAATAMYFALAVTYPVAAGLGGGGICLVHDPARSSDEEFDFLARDTTGGGAFAVPGNVRGFAAMQTVFGALPWARVISSSEGYAAAGFPISQALVTRLQAAENVIRLDAGLASEFMDESGHVRPAGSVVFNRELADTLSAIRTQGADAFYKGAIGDKIVAYSAAQGGSITAAELAGYPLSRRLPHKVQFGEQRIQLPREGTGAGAFAGALFDNVLRAQSSVAQTANTEAEVVAATRQALSGFGVANLPNDLGATGFAATDDNGRAVACAVTMNGPFGSGHTAQGTGVTLASATSTGEAGLAAAFLTPVIAIDGDGMIVLAGAGAGGPIGTASIADALARLGKGEIVTRRANNPTPGAKLYDTVNAILCQGGSCTALIDASANGLGATPGQ
jgi:gamma-glutamyltranspeptidase/glutathione hydrolase